MKKKTSATDSAKWSALQRRCAANAMDQDSIILKAEANSCRFYCAATCSRFGYTFHGCCCSRSSSIETIWPNTLDFHRSLSHKSWKLRTCRTVSHFRLLKLTNFSKKKIGNAATNENQWTGRVTTLDHEAEIVRFCDDHPSRHFKVCQTL